ncbi:MAG: hypothetical protein PHV78_00235 [Patescibacteria group bacterium]|nr:hypothetical protein [Patescibacteria group bacterium]MDD5121400.1 hypothetical protein [Patescibacteria group bacterium]MDD5221874.1 hypothetical protein [Patescibacteria group bacterium]MDD5395681.1 hypothetical protein [Patescibacteria group bacterium]
MIFNILLLIILVGALIIIWAIIFKKLPLVASIPLDTRSELQAEIKKNLMQQRFMREWAAWWQKFFKDTRVGCSKFAAFCKKVFSKKTS